MSSIVELRAFRSMGVTALTSCLWAQPLLAQVPMAAAEIAPAPASSEPIVLQPQSPVLSASSTPSADSASSADWLHRYAPQADLWEAGVFAGPLFISDSNSFRGPIVVNAGAPPLVKPYSNFKQPAVEIGLRGGYYPLSFLGAELEGMVAVAESDTDDGVTVLGARAQVVAQVPFWSIVPFLVGGVGYWSVKNDVSGDDADPAFHYGGGAKLNVTENLALRVDVRDTVTNQRPGEGYPHHVEALAGANLVFGRKAPAPLDSDRDGVLDESDQCPLEAGTLPQGCPVRDSDGDGIVDPDDQCLREAGAAPTGCPIRDADQDGVVDGQDQCIREPGVAPTGCPDSDLDGFLDRADQCPTVAGESPDGCLQDADGDGFKGGDDHCPDQAETLNGFEDGDGCPDELPAAVKSFMGVIAGIEFDNDQATIRTGSQPALDTAIAVLTEYPSLRVEITGHTDDRGSREHNLDLSQRRAEAVKASLVAHGIDAGRIEARGEGPDVPVTTNSTPAGRQKNRRIEFRVLQ
jgi:outer membrane protein OmpA-like peptidoglycan-associated protein